MKKNSCRKIFLVIFLGLSLIRMGLAQSEDLKQQSLNALKKGIQYFYSISIEGGYVYHYTLDLKEKWGEGRTDDLTIEVQPPGTPAVGMSFLRAFKVAGERDFLRAAEGAGDALILGQNDLGGWGHKIFFNRAKARYVSFDDNQTQSAIRFLMSLDQVINKLSLNQAIDQALQMMLMSQLENGGWPHMYPEQGNYHDFATYNDNGINDCIAVMIDANKYYQKTEYIESIHKAGWFMIISQLPPPQPGWAQQYNQYLQPAWARAFEPPAVCPSATLRNLNTLMDLFLYTDSDKYLEPIPDALRWVNESRMPNGKWGRFLEIGTNKPLYYDRGRIRVNSLEELHVERRTGYGYEQDLTAPLKQTRERFQKIMELGRAEYINQKERNLTDKEIQIKIKELEPQIKEILSTQDSLGRWIVKNDRFRKETPGKRWNGEYEFKDRISSALFNKNIRLLCDFIELMNSVNNR
jgi:hypothetical protein